MSQNNFHGTTILCVKHNGSTVIAADGQISLGNSIMKSNAKKLRTLREKEIVIGFAGSTADALTLFERLEEKLEQYKMLKRSAVELAKDWRTDKYLRRLEAMMLVADEKNIFIITGNGDVIEPEDDVAAIGSGGLFALSAARAFKIAYHNVDMEAKDIALQSMKIAGAICVFSNSNIIIEEVKQKNADSTEKKHK